MKLRLLLLSLLAVMWLAPFYCAGSMMPLPVPVYSRLALQYTAAGLFTRRVPAWRQVHIQVQSKGAADWRTIDMAEISPMGGFGYRQRLTRVLEETNGNRQIAAPVQQRLAEWVAREYAKQHPNEGEVTGVRMGQTTWATNTPEMASPSGAWVRDPSDRMATPPFRAYSSFMITQGKAVALAERTSPPLAPAAAPAARIPKVFERKHQEPNVTPPPAQ